MFVQETELYRFIDFGLLVGLLAFESPDDGLANSLGNQWWESVANLPVSDGLFTRKGPGIGKALNSGGHSHCDPRIAIFWKIGWRCVIS